MKNQLKENAWNQSYLQGDNYVFYPHEEVVRFVSRYIRKRTGLDTFEDRQAYSETPRGLDLGCGIGRHVRFMDDMGIEAYGIDLSQVAIDEARRICEQEGRSRLRDSFQIGSITDMPYPDDHFDFIVSHGVLDSLPFELAREAMAEAGRTLRADGYFYLDLISGDDPQHYPEFCGEEVVTGPFENDTIQSYFNFSRIEKLIEGEFRLLECNLIQHRSVISNAWHSRYHLVLGSPAAPD